MAWQDDDDSKDSVARAIEWRRSRSETLTPLETGKGAKIAGNFWGIAWQHHLEGYADYESRLPRARTLLRQGKVLDLEIAEGQATAVVAGQALHEVTVRVKPLDPEHWEEIRSACAGQIGSLLDLVEGRLGDGAMKVIADRESGIFPTPQEIKVICDCPDEASLCPHGAAVLYGIGLKFDADPVLFFRLRGVDHTALISQARQSLEMAASGDAPTIAEGDLAGLFGIEFGDGGGD